jgi:beta-ureidopropionase / N-carbamoyl-L-amino-acid hydrolase
MRRNAGLGMARITELVHEIAMSHQPNAVGAIGHVDVYPNSRNIIPGKVGLHGRLPLARLRRWRRWWPSSEGAGPLAPALGIEDRAEIGAISTRRAFDETASPPVRGRPSGWATATWTSSRAPGTTPAGSTASRRRRW